MRFVKMQGLGNDFVVVDGPTDLDQAAVARLCDRHLGVGADGVLAVSLGAEVGMGYWNADGSRAEMCGNGLRCVARYAFRSRPELGPRFTVATPSGPRAVEILEGDEVAVEVGDPVVVGSVTAAGHEVVRVMVGNPHAVLLVDDPAAEPVATIGPAIAGDPVFPQGSNVELVRMEGGDRLSMRVWERGVGETLACGSGMVAAASVARSLHGVERVEVSVPGGVGVVEFRGGTAWLRGPAVEVFRGEWLDLAQRTRRKTETTLPSTSTPPSNSIGS